MVPPYDMIEATFDSIKAANDRSGLRLKESLHFQREINDYFEYVGIGWKLEGGKMVARGDDAFARTKHHPRRLSQALTEPISRCAR